MTDEVVKLKGKEKSIKLSLSKTEIKLSDHKDTQNVSSNIKQTVTNDNKEELLKKLDDIEDKIENSEKYIELPSTLPRKCRKEIDKIFNVIDRVLDNGLAKELKAQIIKELQPKTKERRDN